MAHNRAMTTVVEALAGVAAQAASQFVDGRNGRVRGSRVVHAVHLARWLGQIQVPAPACHVGIGSFDLAALVATDAPVTCNRCLQAGAYRSHLGTPGAEQLALWDLPPGAAGGDAVEPVDECDQGAAAVLYGEEEETPS
jgi:hypothetical protein